MAQQDLYLLLIHQIGQTGGLQLGIAVISLSSAWQHQVLMKRRHQAKQQQLAQIKGRSLLQRLSQD